MNTVSGLYVHVLRGKCEATAGGVSSKTEDFILTGENVAKVFDIDAARTDQYLVLKNYRGHLYAEPNYPPGPGFNGWMMGGNFIWSSDSRFPGDYPIPVHDRREAV